MNTSAGEMAASGEGTQAPIRIGSRGSALALVQANWVADRLRERAVATEIVIIRTIGDDRGPESVWGEGAFVTAIEAALVDGRVDLAVHSAKDLPTDEDPRLAIACWTAREDPRDALVCRVRGTTLATLPEGARVGTDSPRRTAFLRARRPDLEIHPLSGNVDTRLRKLDEGQSDALILAVAGLTRLGRADRIDEILPLEITLPAPGQGALALQTRADDERAIVALQPLDDLRSRICVQTERAFLAATGGGCRSPIGALAEVDTDAITLRVAAEREVVPGIVRLQASAPAENWRSLADDLAARIVRARSRARVLVTRPPLNAQPLVEALEEAGFDAVNVPTIGISPESEAELDAAVASASDTEAWIVTTSANGVRAALAAMARTGTSAGAAHWAVMGGASAAELQELGIEPFIPSRPLGEVLAREVPIVPGEAVRVISSDIADDQVAHILRARGALVTERVGYRTFEGPPESAAPLSRALELPVDVLTFASGSAVRGLLALAAPPFASELKRAAVVCIGPTTADVARELGFTNVHESPEPTTDSLVTTIATAVNRSTSPRTTAAVGGTR